MSTRCRTCDAELGASAGRCGVCGSAVDREPINSVLPYAPTSARIRPGFPLLALLRRHPVLNAVTALSLLLCVATVVLWVRSYGGWPWDTVTWVRSQTRYDLASERGAIVFVKTVRIGRIDFGQETLEPATRDLAFWQRFGVQLWKMESVAQDSDRKDRRRLSTMLSVVVSYWWPLAVTLSLPVVRLFVYGRRRGRTLENVVDVAS